MDNEPILAQLTRIENGLNEVLLRLEYLSKPVSEGSYPEKWIDGVKVCEILKISPSTLYRHKKKKILKPSKIGGRDYYSESEIYLSLRKYMK